MRKYVIIGIAAIVLLVIAAVICNQGGTSDGDIEAVTDENVAGLDAIRVETWPAQTADIKLSVSETGVVVPRQSVTIMAEVSGIVRKMNVELGDIVNKGGVIAQIDDELLTLALEQAEAQFVNAKAAYEKAEKDLERYKILRDREEISEGEFETFQLQYEQSRAAWMSAQAAKKSAERQLADTRITAPVDGVVAMKSVEEGTMISVGQAVARIVDISLVKVNVNVSEKDIVRLSADMPVEARIDAFPDKLFSGSIFAIGPEASRDTHTFPVEVVIPNDRDPKIRSGMIARVDIISGIISDAVLVPRDAVIERYAKHFVFVVENGTAVEREVRLGAADGTRVQITEGLAAGEPVVVVGQLNLTDGMKVIVR